MQTTTSPICYAAYKKIENIVNTKGRCLYKSFKNYSDPLHVHIQQQIYNVAMHTSLTLNIVIDLIMYEHFWAGVKGGKELLELLEFLQIEFGI